MIIFTCFFYVESQARLDDIFNEHTSIEKPFELRDPFQSPVFQSQTQTQRREKFRGVWDYEQRIPGDIDITQMKVTGVLIGSERRVLIEFGKQTYKLKENERLGNSGPWIKAILPGGIILVEQITNIYGENEYIETVIPISE